MLHVAPQRRPTAMQLVKHPWVNQCFVSQNQQIAQKCCANNSNCNEVHLKETVAATFRAIATSPQVAHLGPVAMSELARRRLRDKNITRVQHS